MSLSTTGKKGGKSGERNLFLAIEEELIRINSICDRTTNERYPVENNRRLIAIPEEQLPQNVDDDCKHGEGQYRDT